MDSRDQGSDERMPHAHDEDGVFHCTAVGYCSEVCPKKVDPANAVNINKSESTKDYFLRFVAPKGAAE
jgi:fumarate reductase iron-sulfur subunit